MGRLRAPPRADPDVDPLRRTRRASVRVRRLVVLVNYPFVYPSAKSRARRSSKKMGGAQVAARVDPGMPSKSTLGGIDLGGSS